jgi:hypothetical protein
MKKKLLILAGDGIGPEVMNEVKKIMGSTERSRLRRSSLFFKPKIRLIVSNIMLFSFLGTKA